MPAVPYLCSSLGLPSLRLVEAGHLVQEADLIVLWLLCAESWSCGFRCHQYQCLCVASPVSSFAGVLCRHLMLYICYVVLYSCCVSSCSSCCYGAVLCSCVILGYGLMFSCSCYVIVLYYACTWYYCHTSYILTNIYFFSFFFLFLAVFWSLYLFLTMYFICVDAASHNQHVEED